MILDKVGYLGHTGNMTSTLISTLRSLGHVFQEHLPAHKASLTLSHNEHKSSYQTVEQFSENREPDWISGKQRDKAIATDELWELHWYPDTPIGSCSLWAADLAELLVYIADPDKYVYREHS